MVPHSPFCQVLKAQQSCLPCLKSSPRVGAGELLLARGLLGSSAVSQGETPVGTCLLDGDFGQATKANLIPFS